MVVVERDGYHKPVSSKYITKVVAIDEPFMGRNDKESDVKACG
jgi:hypothetical protein